MYGGMRVRVEARSFLFFFFFLFLLARVYLFGRPRLVFQVDAFALSLGDYFSSLSSRSRSLDTR